MKMIMQSIDLEMGDMFDNMKTQSRGSIYKINYRMHFLRPV